MFKKPTKVDQATLDQLREEMLFIQKYETDAKTEPGQHLMELLEATIQDTIREFTTKEVDKFDTDAKMVFFLASCRSKLQTVIALKNLYESAAKKKKELSDELERLLANP